MEKLVHNGLLSVEINSTFNSSLRMNDTDRLKIKHKTDVNKHDTLQQTTKISGENKHQLIKKLQ